MGNTCETLIHYWNLFSLFHLLQLDLFYLLHLLLFYLALMPHMLLKWIFHQYLNFGS